MTSRVINIQAFWDAEARVWVAESEDVPGLVTEAVSLEQLLGKLNVMIPELLAENTGADAAAEIPFSLMLQNLHTRDVHNAA